MNVKWIGAAMVVCAGGMIGFFKVLSHRREERLLRQLIEALNLMENQLQYHHSTLPELCRLVYEQLHEIGKCFLGLEQELNNQVMPVVGDCMNTVLKKMDSLPQSVQNNLTRLGASMGRFDLSGQLRDINAVRKQCEADLDKLLLNRDARLRGYQTLGLCAGVALAIILF